jgi:hypothetical protein
MSKKISIYENSLDKAWYDSSNIIYSECDDNQDALKTLRVVFKQGRQYQYSDVDVNDYLLFREGKSQGEALNKFIKKYKAERIQDASLEEIQEEYERLVTRKDCEQIQDLVKELKEMSVKIPSVIAAINKLNPNDEQKEEVSSILSEISAAIS